MPSFIYNPGPGEPEIIKTLDHTFVAGEPVEFPDDHPAVAKLRGNRFFGEEGKGEESAPAYDEKQAKANLAAEKKLDGRTKEAREKRAAADQALAEANAAERSETAMRSAIGTLSPAEMRAMEQIRGAQGDDGAPVPGEAGWRADDKAA